MPARLSVAALLCAVSCSFAPAQNVEQPKLSVEVHALSQCPFASEVLRELIPVVRRLEPRIDLSISYVGLHSEDGWTSAHGAAEMLGDKLQLCAKEVAGSGPWLEFVECQLQQQALPPAAWESCAKRAGIAPNVLSTCAFGPRGNELLTRSFEASQAQGVSESPTLFVAGKRYSGGRGGAFFVRDLCAAMGDHRHPYCDAAPKPPEVRITLLSDRRCEDATCDADVAEQFARQVFAGAVITKLDWSSVEAKQLFEESQLSRLPALVLAPNARSDDWGFARVRAALQGQTKHGFVLPLGGTWDPIAARVDGRAGQIASAPLPAPSAGSAN